MKVQPVKRSLYALIACLPLAAPLTAGAADDAARTKADKTAAAALRKIDALQPLTPGDRAALKAVAKQRKVDHIRVCADPGNMPLSSENREGYQNKIIETVAAAMGAQPVYFWRPYTERGLTRQTFDAGECDILLDMPAGYEGLLTTEPIYKTTYMLASRTDRNLDIKSLDDPRLKTLKIGVYQTSGLRQALAAHGVTNLVLHTVTHDADRDPQHQPLHQVQEVLVDGTLDIAGVWGPFAGWMKAKGAPLTVQPVNLMDDVEPLEFELSIGLRNADHILKYKFEVAIEEKKAEIEAILREYGVPLVQCSRCTIAGDLPAHGIYTAPAAATAERDPSKIAPDQKVTRERLEAWLAEGADLNAELANAVLAADAERVTFLLEKGADINSRDPQGYTPLHTAARNRNPAIINLLMDHKADAAARDSDGLTPLYLAIQRDDPASVQALASRGAGLDSPAPGGYTPLGMAIAEDRMAAAMALIQAGAPVNTPSGADKLTPLMIAAGREPVHFTLAAGRRPIEKLIPNYPGALEIAQALVEHGADVDAVSGSGVTALILAAAHNQVPIVGLLVQARANGSVKAPDGRTALDIARANGNEPVVSIIRLLDESGAN
jgi:quinoprotein dehydrogenase-associated probable ABC transporter substrate-binding protein